MQESYILPKRISHTGACLFESGGQDTLPSRVANDVRKSHSRVILANVFLKQNC